MNSSSFILSSLSTFLMILKFLTAMFFVIVFRLCFLKATYSLKFLMSVSLKTSLFSEKFSSFNKRFRKLVIFESISNICLKFLDRFSSRVFIFFSMYDVNSYLIIDNFFLNFFIFWIISVSFSLTVLSLFFLFLMRFLIFVVILLNSEDVSFCLSYVSFSLIEMFSLFFKRFSCFVETSDEVLVVVKSSFSMFSSAWWILVVKSSISKMKCLSKF